MCPLRVAGRRGELQQRQRITLRLLDDPAEDTGRQVHELARQQLHRLRLGQRRDGELRQPGTFEESADTRPDGTR